VEANHHYNKTTTNNNNLIYNTPHDRNFRVTSAPVEHTDSGNALEIPYDILGSNTDNLILDNVVLSILLTKYCDDINRFTN